MKTNSAQLDLSSGQTWGVTRTRVQHNFDEVYSAIENTYIAALIGGNISGSLITSGTVDDSYIDTNIPRLDGIHTITGTYSFPETAYSVSTWDALSTPVTKNSFRDYMFNFDADGDGSFTDESWFPSGSSFNPAAPGAIGGTTPAAGTFTTVTAAEFNSSATDGDRGIIFPENTTKSPGSGLEEIYNEAGVMKYSEGGVEKNFVAIDDTGGDGDTTVTLSADKIVELIASGGSGVQDGTSTDDILSWDGDSWEPIALTAHPAFASLLAAFNNAGLNSFTFTPAVTYPLWAATSPVSVSFDVTDTSTAYAVSDVDYQYDGTGGFVSNMTNTTGDTWTADVTIATDGAHTIQLEAVDDKSTPNSGQSAVYTINFDGTDPVVGTVTPSSLTHDGTGVSLSATIASVTETNEENREWSLYDVTDAAVEIDWSVFTGLSIATVLIPSDQHTYRVDVRVTDLAGNVGSVSSSNITYSAGATNIFEWACDSLLAAVYDADDGGTITKTGTTAYVTGVTGNAIQFSPAAYAYAVATNGNNITWGDFDLEFDYRLDSTVNNGTYVVSTPYANPQQFAMYYSSTYPTSISFWVAGTNYRTAVTETLWTDTTFHHIRLVLNCASQTLTVYVDSSQYDIDLSSTTAPNPATGRLHFNGFNSTTDNQTATFDNVEIR